MDTLTMVKSTSRRVLVVDDLPDVRRELSQLLQLSGGLEVVGEAANGQEAVQKVTLCCPEVILLDLEMPVLDGYQAAKQIRKQCPSCWIVGLSIHPADEAEGKALKAGVD